MKLATSEGLVVIWQKPFLGETGFVFSSIAVQ